MMKLHLRFQHIASEACLFGLCIFLFMPASMAKAQEPENDSGAAYEFLTDAKGRMTGIAADGEVVPFTTGLSIFGPGWDPFYTLDNAENVQKQALPERAIWNGVIPLADGQVCEYWGMVQEGPREGYLKVTLRAKSNLDIEGAFFHIRLPVADYMDGEVNLHGLGGQAPSRLILPRNQPNATHILCTKATQGVTISLPARMLGLDVAVNAPCRVQVQDNRRWHSPYYVLMFQMSGPDMKEGGSVAINLTFEIAGEPDHTPVTLALEENGLTDRVFEGVGGNYCFAIDSPQTDRTLADFHTKWSRTEISLRDWEPQNENGDPGVTHWGHFKSRDKKGGNLNREFLLAKLLQDRGTKLIASIWDLPEWMYATQGKEPYTHERRVPDEMWDEVIESIITYLVHARDEYGGEPDLLSFKEHDAGICVLMPPAIYRTVMERLAAELEKNNLKTRLLLGDVSNPRHAYDYVQTVVNDSVSLAHYGAIGFHSWGGGSADDYRAWRTLADDVELPLLVPEVGVDPKAWRTQTFHSWYYALQELEMFQRILLYAQPLALLEWEFTADYALLVQNEPAEPLKPTKRYWFLYHFANLMPVPAQPIKTASSHPRVLFSAFKSAREADQATITLHIANLGAAREMTLTGLPPEYETMQGWLTTRDLSMAEVPAVKLEGETIGYELPAQSLLTLQLAPPVPEPEEEPLDENALGADGEAENAAKVPEAELRLDRNVEEPAPAP